MLKVRRRIAVVSAAALLGGLVACLVRRLRGRDVASARRTRGEHRRCREAAGHPRRPAVQLRRLDDLPDATGTGEDRGGHGGGALRRAHGTGVRGPAQSHGAWAWRVWRGPDHPAGGRVRPNAAHRRRGLPEWPPTHRERARWDHPRHGTRGGTCQGFRRDRIRAGVGHRVPGRWAASSVALAVRGDALPTRRTSHRQDRSMQRSRITVTVQPQVLAAAEEEVAAGRASSLCVVRSGAVSRPARYPRRAGGRPGRPYPGWTERCTSQPESSLRSGVVVRGRPASPAWCALCTCRPWTSMRRGRRVPCAA